MTMYFISQLVLLISKELRRELWTRNAQLNAMLLPEAATKTLSDDASSGSCDEEVTGRVKRIKEDTRGISVKTS